MPLKGGAGANEEQARWTAKTARQFRSAAMLAQKAIDRPIVTITQDDLVRLYRLFGRLPKTHHKAPRQAAMTLEAICTDAEARVAQGALSPRSIGLSGTTTNRHFSFLKILCDWVARAVPMAPLYWGDFRVADRRDRRNARAAYSIDQGRALFQLPLWTGCASKWRRFKPGSSVFHDSGYWVPMIVWYSGGRRSEVCARLVAEVRCIEGIWCLMIEFNALGRLKNETSRRWIPIHSELIRLGFLDYVEALRDRGETMLFPDLAAPKTPPGDVWYKRFGLGVRNSLDFLTEGMMLHSARHMVETELSEAEVFPKFCNDLLGHANPSEGGGRYAKRTRLSKLAEIVEQIPVVTGHLDPQPLVLRLTKGGRVPRSVNASATRRRVIPRPRLVWDAERDPPLRPK